VPTRERDTREKAPRVLRNKSSSRFIAGRCRHVSFIGRFPPLLSISLSLSLSLSLSSSSWRTRTGNEQRHVVSSSLGTLGAALFSGFFSGEFPWNSNRTSRDRCRVTQAADDCRSEHRPKLCDSKRTEDQSFDSRGGGGFVNRTIGGRVGGSNHQPRPASRLGLLIFMLTFSRFLASRTFPLKIYASRARLNRRRPTCNYLSLSLSRARARLRARVHTHRRV